MTVPRAGRGRGRWRDARTLSGAGRRHCRARSCRAHQRPFLHHRRAQPQPAAHLEVAGRHGMRGPGQLGLAADQPGGVGLGLEVVALARLHQPLRIGHVQLVDAGPQHHGVGRVHVDPGGHGQQRGIGRECRDAGRRQAPPGQLRHGLRQQRRRCVAAGTDRATGPTGTDRAGRHAGAGARADAAAALHLGLRHALAQQRQLLHRQAQVFEEPGELAQRHRVDLPVAGQVAQVQA